MLRATYQTHALKLNGQGNLLDTCLKVKCSGHIEHVPTLARLETTGLFDSPANDGLLPSFAGLSNKPVEKPVDFRKEKKNKLEGSTKAS